MVELTLDAQRERRLRPKITVRGKALAKRRAGKTVKAIARELSLSPYAVREILAGRDTPGISGRTIPPRSLSRFDALVLVWRLGRLAIRPSFSTMDVAAALHLPDGVAFALLCQWEAGGLVARETREGSRWRWNYVAGDPAPAAPTGAPRAPTPTKASRRRTP